MYAERMFPNDKVGDIQFQSKTRQHIWWLWRLPSGPRHHSKTVKPSTLPYMISPSLYCTNCLSQ